MTAIPAMTATAPNWRMAAALAALGHAALLGVLLATVGTPKQTIPDPVMIIELPEGLAPASEVPLADEMPVQDRAEPLPTMVPPDLDIPEMQAPVPTDPVVLPTPRPIPPITRAPSPRPDLPRPQAAAPPRLQPPAPSTGSGNAGSGPADDPRAQQQQADWYALIAAHLERNKRYPREARRDGLQGTPTVRFTVDRRGRVSNISISSSSGHTALDEATIDLMRRVSPLPAMPRSMGRDSVTISLPIEYTLRRN